MRNGWRTRRQTRCEKRLLLPEVARMVSKSFCVVICTISANNYCRDQVEQNPEDRQAWFRSMWEGKQEDDTPTQETPQTTQSNIPDDDAEDADDDFGDDFDEFAEGGEDDDFGDFDEPTTPAPVPEQQPQSYSLPDALAGLVSSHQISPYIYHGLDTNSNIAAFRPQT